MSCPFTNFARKNAILLVRIVIRDGFCLFYNARTKKVDALNGSGSSPEKLNIDYVRQRGITGPRIPFDDLNSVTVPGASTSMGGQANPYYDVRMCWCVGGYR